MAKGGKRKDLISAEELAKPDVAIDPQELTNKALNISNRELIKLDAWSRMNPNTPMMKDDVNSLNALILSSIRAAKEYREAAKGGLGEDLSELSDEDLDRLLENISKLRAERKKVSLNGRADSSPRPEKTYETSSGPQPTDRASDPEF